MSLVPFVVVLHPEMEDRHIWQLDASGVYSARSTYKGFIQGAIVFGPWDWIWKSWAQINVTSYVTGYTQ